MTALRVSLQPLMPNDWPQIAPLVRAFYAHFGYRFSDRVQGRVFRQLLADPRRGAAWMIKAGDTPCGYVVLAHGWSIEYGGLVSVVDELFVSPDHRGAGIGRRTLALVRREARRLGARRLFLEVESYNRRAKSLYAREGFTDTRRTLMRMDVKR